MKKHSGHFTYKKVTTWPKHSTLINVKCRRSRDKRDKMSYLAKYLNLVQVVNNVIGSNVRVKMNIKHHFGHHTSTEGTISRKIQTQAEYTTD